MHPLVSLRAFPPLSHGCAMRAGGRSQRAQAKGRLRTQAKRRLRGLAALARLPSLGLRQYRQLHSMSTAMDQGGPS